MKADHLIQRLGLKKLPGEGGYYFMGTTMAPGFEFEDFKLGAQESLTLRFPQHETLIRELT